MVYRSVQWKASSVSKYLQLIIYIYIYIYIYGGSNISSLTHIWLKNIDILCLHIFVFILSSLGIDFMCRRWYWFWYLISIFVAVYLICFYMWLPVPTVGWSPLIAMGITLLLFLLLGFRLWFKLVLRWLCWYYVGCVGISLVALPSLNVYGK